MNCLAVTTVGWVSWAGRGQQSGAICVGSHSRVWPGNATCRERRGEGILTDLCVCPFKWLALSWIEHRNTAWRMARHPEVR